MLRPVRINSACEGASASLGALSVGGCGPLSIVRFYTWVLAGGLPEAVPVEFYASFCF